MAIIGVSIPSEVSKKLSSIDVPGKKEDSSSYHITLAFLGKDVPMKEILKTIDTISEIIHKSIKLKISKIDCFPKGEDGVPIKCVVESKELENLREKIINKLDKEKIEYSKKFPEFKPHVTLSYNPEKIEEFEIESIEWTTSEIFMWCGDDKDDGMVITFPLCTEKNSGNHLFELCGVFEKLSHNLFH